MESDFEENYKKEIEKADREFLQDMKGKANINEIEIKYKKSLRLSREKYYKSVQKNLRKNKYTSKVEIKLEKTEPLNIKPQKFQLNFFQRIKFRLKLYFFRSSFFTRNFIRRHTSNSILVIFIKIRIGYKKVKVATLDLVSKISNSIVIVLVKIWEFIKEKSNILFKKSFDIITKVPTFLKRKPAVIEEKVASDKTSKEKNEE